MHIMLIEVSKLSLDVCEDKDLCMDRLVLAMNIALDAGMTLRRKKYLIFIKMITKVIN